VFPRNVELLSFHKLAEHKYESLGLEYKVKDYPLLPENKLCELAEIFHRYGVKAIF
jgi:pyruvate-formate lyase-activating enzyme